MAWDSAGLLWESEHGPTGGDEINIIEKGKNYGWGVISMGVQNGITERSHEGMEQPIVYYTPTIAPSGIGFYTGSKYPGWKNNLFVAALAGQQLRRLEISGRKVVHQEVVFEQFGRVRAVTTGPDGLLMCCCRIRRGRARESGCRRRRRAWSFDWCRPRRSSRPAGAGSWEERFRVRPKRE